MRVDVHDCIAFAESHVRVNNYRDCIIAIELQLQVLEHITIFVCLYTADFGVVPTDWWRTLEHHIGLCYAVARLDEVIARSSSTAFR